MPNHVDEFGTRVIARIRVDSGPRCSTPLDLTDAKVFFLFTKPSSSIVEVEASFVGAASKGIAEYVVPEGFFDEVGSWQWQIRIEADANAGQWWSALESFVLDEHLVPDP